MAEFFVENAENLEVSFKEEHDVQSSFCHISLEGETVDVEEALVTSEQPLDETLPFGVSNTSATEQMETNAPPKPNAEIADNHPLVGDGLASGSSGTVLPWGAYKEKMQFPASVSIDTNIKPGEFVMQTLFAEFVTQVERKVDAVMAEPLERPLSKSLQRGEDAIFDQLLSAFSSVAEHCLPSLLRTLFAWYDWQMVESISALEQKQKAENKNKNDVTEKSEKDYLNEKRDLAIEFIFCLLLIEVLKQLPVHPGHEDLVSHIETLAFKHFKYRDSVQTGMNAANFHIVADLYAEVIGVLAQARFQSVRKKFMFELKELRSKESAANPSTTQGIISLLMGMKFFRIKMVPIEEFEASFQFMQECAQYFLEVKDKDIKHALAGLFVEILVPVAAMVKNEVNVPVLKNFVEMLYSQTLDNATKKKHSLALFPLVTCLLCVSQKTFFLQNWHYFLAMCLSHLKNKDPKLSRVALESLYRLLWVYMIRIKCESNTATQSRLQSIVNSLFPKGSKAVVPRDTPLNIFVKIIQFVAQERLDFAMKEIVFDLISVGRPIKIILTPERMSIGLRAFLVVADSLQQKEGEPPMPRTIGVLPSGNTLRVKKTFLNKMLTEDTAKSIGISTYYPFVRKAFNDILRALDVQFGRPLMMTNVQNVNKEIDDMITGERKPKIDLFRTCVAAIPRLIPDGMSRQDLVDLLSRLTVHWDEELRGLAFQSLQNLVLDFPDWREDVVYGFVQFVIKEVNDTFSQLLDNNLRMLLQILTTWKNAISSQQHQIKKEAWELSPSCSRVEPLANVLHYAEAFALVVLCNLRLLPRRLAVSVLKELKFLLKTLCSNRDDDQPVIDVLDRSCPAIIERVIHLLPAAEKAALLSASNVDLQWLVERNSSVWTSGTHDISNDSANKGHLTLFTATNYDIWAICLTGFLETTGSATALAQSWPIVFTRISSLFSVIDPNPISDNRTSLLRTATTVKKIPNERDNYLNLWKNYIMFACQVIPPNVNPVIRCASPDLSISSSPDSMASDRSDSRSPSSANISPSAFYKLVVPLLRCEASDIRDAVVDGMGKINPDALRDLMEELVIYIREAIDRKQENMRRRRRRDALRVQLVKMFELISENGTFSKSPNILEGQNLQLTFVEYIDGARQYLESENDKDVPVVQEIKFHFCRFVCKLIQSFPLESRPALLSRVLRQNLFYLFASWSGKFGIPPDKRFLKEECSDVEYQALQAMTTVLCCGPTFEAQILSDDSSIYTWLDTLLGTNEEKIYQLAQETIVLLLEFNPDMSSLLDWVVDRCYTGTNKVADGCFNALSTIFSAREYPCDHYTAIINVTLMNTGCPRASIHETALQLLQILDKRFFGSQIAVVTDDSETEQEQEMNGKRDSTDVLLSATYSRSQMYLSRQLAFLHPELTMPMISEISHRFQTARHSVRQILLQYLLPWLYNMELVDPNIPPANPLSQFLTKMQDYYVVDPIKQPLRREGWGSAEATEMVLNNLFYITVKFGDEHSKEIEELWAALCSCWPNNLKIIIRYLFIVSGMAPTELLLCAKRVVVFLGRARAERLVDELMNELQTVETLNCLIERTETPPFFRVTSMRKTSSHSDATSSGTQPDAASRSELGVEKGTIHTKRHSGEDPMKDSGNKGSSSCHGSLRSTSSMSSGSSCKDHSELKTITSVGSSSTGMPEGSIDVDNFTILRHQSEEKSETPLPHPLPMPEYGGYFAPLTEFLPDSSQPVTGFHRCNLAIMLLTDVVVDGLEIDWSIHIPLMLHIIFLGLDHTRPLVYEHCKKLLSNLLIVLTCHNDHLTIARILLNNKTDQSGYGLTSASAPLCQNYQFTDPAFDIRNISELPKPESTPPTARQQKISITSVHDDNNSSSTAAATTATLDEQNNLGTCESAESSCTINTEEMIKSLINFIAARVSQSLWNYEDITARVWSIRSAEQLECFLRQTLGLFKESQPQALIEERWAQIALQLALSCSSRHYAGRSLQIFRALRVPITTRMLSDILSRLVETVAEQGEDMQGYVTEIMLTLEAAVDSLDSDFRPIDFVKELFKSTPNLNKDNRKSAPTIPVSQSYHGQPPQPGHTRSTSYSVSFCTRKPTGSPAVEMKEVRARSNTESDAHIKSTNLSRSRSAQSLKMMADQNGQDDKMTILSQLFWISVSMLESDYEHEFLLAMRLLEKVLKRLPLDRPDCQEKLEKLQQQLKWSNFPGVQAMLLKGCTSPVTFEPTLHLLAKFTLLSDIPMVDPTQSSGFPMNVITLLPYMLQNYEDPNVLCIHSAENIAQVCQEKSKKLENLATVMTLYSRRTFSKESFQWTKCVVKYLYDTYAHLSLNMMVFLVEVLEKGPQSTQQAILTIIQCMLHYQDVNATSVQAINGDLLRAIARYIEGPYSKEALKILKLIVTRCSVLAAPPLFPSHYGETISISSHTSFAEAEVCTKKELPGRTMDFTFDISRLHVIGSQFLVPTIKDDVAGDGKIECAASKPSVSPHRSLSFTQSHENGLGSGWKKPWLSQARTRECLVNLLTSCGQRVGLPKSPSVIFSQTSDIIDRQSSMCSSTEEVSMINNEHSGESKLDDSGNTDPQQFGVIKEFDFLEYELESQEGESMDKFNWMMRRPSLSTGDGDDTSHLKDNVLTGSVPNLNSQKEESSDDELGSGSPIDDSQPHTVPGLQFRSSSLLERHRRQSSPTSGSSHSICSDQDLGDLTPSNNSPNFTLLTAAYTAVSVDELEETWRNHVVALMSDASAFYFATHTYSIFGKLFREIRYKFVMFVQESCHYLGMSDSMRLVLPLFHNALEILNNQVSSSFMFVDAETIRTLNLLDKHKFSVLELQEHLETYSDKKDHATECLDNVKASLKIQSMGENLGEGTLDDQLLDLSRSLFKLHFHFLLVFESYCKLIGMLTTTAKNHQICDLSQDVINVYQEIMQTSPEAETGKSQDIEVATTRASADLSLYDLMFAKQWNKALRYVKVNRNHWLADQHRHSEEDEIEIILNVYCQQLLDKFDNASKMSGIIISIKTDEELSDLCSRLMEINVQLSTSIRMLERMKLDRDRSDSNIRKTEC